MKNTKNTENTINIESTKKPLSRLKKILLTLLVIILIPVVAFLIYAAFVFGTYYRIEDNLPLEIQYTNASPDSTSALDSGAAQDSEVPLNAPASTDAEYTIVSANIGFGAYSSDYSFFMDGGKYSWAYDRDAVYTNVNGSAGLVNGYDPDFIFIQEIDIDSTRSYHINELDILNNNFSGYYMDFAKNYHSAFLMYPLTQPHGKSNSGLATYSRFEISSGLRRSFPVSTSFSKLIDLDRCYSISRIPVDNGKELILINLHMSAYGSDDSVREGQIAMLCDDMQKELEAGNYIICGGDFNHDLLNYDENVSSATGWAYPFPRSVLPSHMEFALDRLEDDTLNNLHNSARNADVPYEEGNYTVTLDSFIISDNIELIYYDCFDSGYSYSDHEPIAMSFKLK